MAIRSKMLESPCLVLKVCQSLREVWIHQNNRTLRSVALYSSLLKVRRIIGNQARQWRLIKWPSTVMTWCLNLGLASIWVILRQTRKCHQRDLKPISAVRKSSLSQKWSKTESYMSVNSIGKIAPLKKARNSKTWDRKWMKSSVLYEAAGTKILSLIFESYRKPKIHRWLNHLAANTKSNLRNDCSINL